MGGGGILGSRATDSNPGHSPAHRPSSYMSLFLPHSASAVVLDLPFLTIPPAPRGPFLPQDICSCCSLRLNALPWALHIDISFSSYKSQLKCSRESFLGHPSLQTKSCPPILSCPMAQNPLHSSHFLWIVKIYLCEGRAHLISQISSLLLTIILFQRLFLSGTSEALCK